MVTIEPTNEFLTGEVNFPDGYSIGSWKTGTTEEALNCLIMELKNDSTGEEYIALVAGADGKEALYSAMTELINKTYRLYDLLQLQYLSIQVWQTILLQ